MIDHEDEVRTRDLGLLGAHKRLPTRTLRIDAVHNVRQNQRAGAVRAAGATAMSLNEHRIGKRFGNILRSDHGNTE